MAEKTEEESEKDGIDGEDDEGGNEEESEEESE